MEELSTGIGKRIKTLRMIQHMNQEQLAEELDITVKHMSEVERGKSLLSLEKLVYLADILDCDMNYLITEKYTGISPYNFRIRSFKFLKPPNPMKPICFLLIWKCIRIYEHNANIK